MTRRMTRVTLLTQADCTYCDHAKDVLARVSSEHPLTVEEIWLETAEGRELAVRHGVLFAPGILLDGQPFGYGRLAEKKLRKELARRAATTRR
jgi:glutaredoxin